MIATPFGKAILLARRLGLSFLARFDFPGAWSNVLVSPRTAQPGPGTLVITDTNNKLSIVGGKLTFATGGVGAGDPGVWGAQLTRRAGLAVVAVGVLTANGLIVGWDSNQVGNLVDAFRFLTTSLSVFDQSTSIDGGLTVSGATTYSIAVVQRGTGFFIFIKGGIYTNWTVVWVGAVGTANYFPAGAALTTTAVATLDTFRVLDLAAPFSTDFGLATQRLAGAQSAGQTFTHEANCVIEWIQTTVPSAAGTTVNFRRQDASNYWQVNVIAGGTLTLWEVVAGVFTSRGSVGAGTVTDGHRIVVVADGSTIRVYSNNVLRFTYSSASNFATATSGILNALGTGGAVSDIISWPRTLSGATATLLDDAVNGIGTFLLNDEFTTTEGGAIPSPYTEGNGSLVITDTNAKMSIASGKLTFATGGATLGDPGVWEASRVRSAGLTVVGKINPASSGIEIGWDTNQLTSPLNSIRFASGLDFRSNGTAIAQGSYSFGVEYSLAIVLRSNGSLFLIKGGVFSVWTVYFVGFGDTTTPLYANAAIINATSIATLDNFRVLDLAAPFNDSYGLATQRLAGAQSAGVTFTHEANCVIEWVQTTVPSASSTRVMLRRQDANNRWDVVINSSGDITLWEVVAGSGTSRANASAVVANGHRVVIVCDGTTIRGYSNNVLRWTYSSASNFAAATAGELNALGTGGAVSDIISWPRVLPAAAAALLDASIA